MIDLKELLCYALGGDAPEGFLNKLLQRRHLWDATFIERLDDLAHEFRPDLTLWELRVLPDGTLNETRLPLVR